MSLEEIKAFLASPNIKEAIGKSEDYFNCHFKTVHELEDLESLVLDAQRIQEELNSDLSQSQLEVDALLSDARDSTKLHLNTAEELSLLRHSLADELADLSDELLSSVSVSERPPTLLEDLETLHRNLQELESVKGYVRIIEHALSLRESSLDQIRQSSNVTMASLAKFQTLELFVTKVSEECSNAIENASEQGQLRLVQFLDRIRQRTWEDIKSILSSALIAASEQLGWPMTIDYLTTSSEDRKTFESAFINLCRLQAIGEKIRSDSSTSSTNKSGLYSLQALVQPVALRFRYHFEGNRQTNRLDKPEWYFTHILNVAHEHHQFFDTAIQPLLVPTDYGRFNAWREFALLLIPILSRKLKKTVPILISRPSLLAHTIYQTLLFDTALLEEGFEISGTTAAATYSEGKWEGVSEIILGNQQWFEAWLLGEKKFVAVVEEEYNEITSSSDAWLIVNDETESEDHASRELRSTNSARRVKALLEQITDRYASLPHQIQRLRFLSDIQLPLLESYRARISASLDAFETLSSAFVRAVPGALSVGLSSRDESRVNVDSRKLTSGVEGMQRLCKAFVSAAFLEVSLKAWGEEVFFVELWVEANQDTAMRTLTELNPLLTHLHMVGEDMAKDTIFEEMINRYRTLVVRAEDMIVQQTCGEAESGIKVHLSVSTEPDLDENTLSRTLLTPMGHLSSHLNYLGTTLPQSSFTALYRRIASRLAEHIKQRQILYRGHFGLQEGRIIRAECELWVETCHLAIAGSLGGGRQRVEAPWSKLLQAGRLAGAEGDVWYKVVQATFGTQSEDEWERAMIEQIGLSEMTREDVRSVLERRTDCAHH